MSVYFSFTTHDLVFIPNQREIKGELPSPRSRLKFGHKYAHVRGQFPISGKRGWSLPRVGSLCRLRAPRAPQRLRPTRALGNLGLSGPSSPCWLPGCKDTLRGAGLAGPGSKAGAAGGEGRPRARLCPDPRFPAAARGDGSGALQGGGDGGQGRGEAAVGVWGAVGRSPAGRKGSLSPGTCRTWTAPTPSHVPQGLRRPPCPWASPAALSPPGLSPPDFATRLRPQLHWKFTSVLSPHPEPARPRPAAPGAGGPAQNLAAPERATSRSGCEAAGLRSERPAASELAAAASPHPAASGSRVLALRPSVSSCSPAARAAGEPRRERTRPPLSPPRDAEPAGDTCSGAAGTVSHTRATRDASLCFLMNSVSPQHEV